MWPVNITRTYLSHEKLNSASLVALRFSAGAEQLQSEALCLFNHVC